MSYKIWETEVYMNYFPENHKNPVHENYKIYNLPYVIRKKYLEEKKNILIIPECIIKLFHYQKN